ncbi:MAG: reverse transcriptase family protein [Sedimenticola sp.]
MALAERKKIYKQYANRSKQNFQSVEGNMLSQLKRINPKQFYKLFKKRKQNKVKTNLKAEDFKNFFVSLMDNTTADEQTAHLNIGDPVYGELDVPFTESEILTEVRKLKQDKSPGNDELLNEVFIAGKTCLIPLLCKLFNKILTRGEYPTEWTTGIVIPVFKKGNPNDAGNYRPITLISHLAKLFTSVLNSRLLAWSQQNDIITDAQYGFKPGFGTTDAIFALHAIVSKYLNSSGRLYTCFIDYKKAFDTVDHYKLWRRMIKSGITGKLFQVINSMYKNIRLAIRHSNETSDFYKCSTGLLQGEALSPFLFSLLINDLELDLMHNSCPSINIEEINIFILMYADDTVLLAESAAGLQTIINQLDNYTTEWGLTINVAKTKVLVFRKSWQLRKEEKWFYKGTEIEIVNQFCYLGIMLNYNGKFNTTQKHLAEQARKAQFNLMKVIKQSNFNVTTMLDLFDTYLAPILNYGSELWGTNKAPEIERVHTSFIKRILGVKRSASNAMVYNEVARMPLYLTRCNRIVKYWTKLLSTNNCILKSLYEDMLQDCEANTTGHNWLRSVKDILLKLGMNEFWISQEPGDVNIFLARVRQRLADQFFQTNDSTIETCSKCEIYKYFDKTRGLAKYLCKPIPELRRKTLSRFRLSAHSLAIETGRYNRTDRRDRVCAMCELNVIEDEYHLILICPKYSELRARLIRPYFYRRPSAQKLVELLDAGDIKTITNLTRYITLAMRLREGHV